MSIPETALWWARVRSAGPVPVTADLPTPAGLLRLAEPGSDRGWLVRAIPETAAPAVADELGLATIGVEQPNDTARVLAAVVRCCWPELGVEIWPGSPARWDTVMEVFRVFAPRQEAAVQRSAVAAVRRLHGAGWVRWDEAAQSVRLGPATATWSPADLTVVREMCRRMPVPQERAPQERGLS